MEEPMKRFAAAATFAVAIAFATPLPAQEFPNRPITMIVPWAAGGGADTFARAMAAEMERLAKVPLNVVNRTGGSGVVGHTAISTANADCYTIGVATPEMTLMKLSGIGDLSQESFTLIARGAEIPAGLTVHADSPYKTAKDLLEAIRKEPAGKFISSGSGTGGVWHIALGGFLMAAGLEVNRVRFVPSQGGAPALNDLMAGGINLFTGSPIEAKTLAEAGKVRILASMSPTRMPAFSGLPTSIEATGVDWTFMNWFALIGPKGMPKACVDKLVDIAAGAHKSKTVQDFFAARGIVPVWETGDQFAKFVSDFTATNGKVIKALDLKK
jgi:tripartite-type tricarboxylate transporter receptor subunit TctC